MHEIYCVKIVFQVGFVKTGIRLKLRFFSCIKICQLDQLLLLTPIKVFTKN